MFGGPKNPRLKRPLSGPALTIVSINIEGITRVKEEFLSTIFKSTSCDIMCVQETHRDQTLNAPNISGMKLAAIRHHRKHGSAIFTKPNMTIQSVKIYEQNDIEFITLHLPNISVSSIYKPPNSPFIAPNLKSEDTLQRKPNIVIGDFNSHSSSWGYTETNEDGEAVEIWAQGENMVLIHDNKLPPSFNSGRWKKGYNPDLIFASDSISQLCTKKMGDPIPNTQHRPIICQIEAVVRPNIVPFQRRYNFMKAKWNLFSEDLDSSIENLEPLPEHYESFVEKVKCISRKHIPRGCRTHHIPGLSSEIMDKYNTYINLFENNPFEEQTRNKGEELTNAIAQEKRNKWHELLNKTDMKHSSKKAWGLIKRLNSDPTKEKGLSNVTPDQIAHQLLLNGKPQKLKQEDKPNKRIIRNKEKEGNHLSRPFEEDEMNIAIETMKLRKAAGLDNIFVEQIRNFGPKAKRWMLDLYNEIRNRKNIPKIWRKTKIIALLKPGKDMDDPKNYRPISLLCHTYKLFERMLLNRLVPFVDSKLIREQAGFRPGKSCTGQILNLTQTIENGFENKKVTGVAFIDLTAAYDTVNHRLMLKKLYDITLDYEFVRVFEALLGNRRFFVNHQGKNSKWRTSRNGLPQGSVLAPTMFNIYTNDQPISIDSDVKHYIYADDTAIAVQHDQFENVEEKLSATLDILGKYYRRNYLKPNPSKTQVCAFHLRNRYANRILNVYWNETKITNTQCPKYLGITLDRSLTYRFHCENTKQKIMTRNGILRKLSGSTWGCNPHVLRTTALALCFSAGEYASPVWGRSSHTKKVDVALNESCRLITGCLKNTPVEQLFILSGIAPPPIRRSTQADWERTKITTDPRHPMYGTIPQLPRLKSRKSFMNHTKTISSTHPEEERTTRWRNEISSTSSWVPNESLPSGHNETWPVWRTLNRLRTGIGRTKDNLIKWGLLDSTDTLCICGEVQTMQHIITCTASSQTCTLEDIHKGTSQGINVARIWAETI